MITLSAVLLYSALYAALCVCVCVCVQGSMVIVKESVYPFKSGDGDSHSCKTNL